MKLHSTWNETKYAIERGPVCQAEAEFVDRGLENGRLHIPCRPRQLASLGLLLYGGGVLGDWSAAQRLILTRMINLISLTRDEARQVALIGCVIRQEASGVHGSGAPLETTKAHGRALLGCS